MTVLDQYTQPKPSLCSLAHSTQGFVPACPGVTGLRVTMESRVEGLISMLHEVTDKSVAVGFGISTPDAV